MLRKVALSSALAVSLMPSLGFAQQPAPAAPPGTSPGSSATTSPAAAAPAETPEHNITGNIGLFSQYIFRGLTQTDRDPALQGGFDYAHSSGFYAGTWASNISWLKENASTPAAGPGTGVMGTYSRGGSLEWDFYGGYKGTIGDFGYDLGTLYYWYPGDINPAVAAASAPNDVPKADTWEIYAGTSWKWLSAKFSYSVMDKTFGVKDSRGTYYLDLSANIPLGDFMKELTGFTINAHWGYQKYRGTDPRNYVVNGTRLDNDDLYSYKDVKLGVSYLLPKDFTIGAFYSKAYDADVLGYGSVNDVGAGGNRGVFPRNIAKGTGTVFLQKTF
jgi:uncharacterized protein (TIGR02001 family)